MKVLQLITIALALFIANASACDYDDDARA